MTTFASYQGGADQPETEVHYEPVRIRDTVTRTSTVDGVFTEDSTTIERGDSNVNPYAGTDSILATARNKDGSAASIIGPDTLVEIDGLQAPISFWIAEGRLSKTSDGSFTEAGEARQQTESAPEGFAPMSDQAMARVNAALEPVDQSDLDGLASTAVAVGLGKFDRTALVSKFSTASGLSPEEASASVNAILAEYQAHADRELMKGSGLDAGDLASFYTWAKETKPGALQEAMQMHFHAQSMNGFKDLAAQWLATTPPSLAALKKSGVPTRSNGNGHEVFVRGQWMSLGAAARAGIL
jgi:hypothetical protein